MTFPAFDLPVHDNGYRWWYIDAISDDGDHALTCIAFVGSVFSPYYAWARRRQRFVRAIDHCAINLALYGSPSRWCMTERARESVSRSADCLQIGPSRIRVDRDDNGLLLSVAVTEVAVPLPLPVRARLTIRLPDWTIEPVSIDRDACHWWQPIAPHVRIDVILDERSGRGWSGNAYVDSNAGSIPLENSFEQWQWSRTHRADGTTDIQYDVLERDGYRPDRTFSIDRDGNRLADRPDAPAVRRTLPTTRWWRIPRSLRVPTDTAAPRVTTLEDTPFYARSRIGKRGSDGDCVHESLLLDRFDHPVTRCLLPFRMPRRAHRGAGVANST